MQVAVYICDKMSIFVEYTDPQWRDLDMRALDVDQSYLYLKSEYPERSYLYTLSDECYTVLAPPPPPPPPPTRPTPVTCSAHVTCAGSSRFHFQSPQSINQLI